MGMLDQCKRLYDKNTLEAAIFFAVLRGYSEKTSWVPKEEVDRLRAEGFTVRVNQATENEANVTVSGWAC